jgi:putative oxidoreductase
MKQVASIQPVVLSLYRIVVGLLFFCHGLSSLFGVFGGVDKHGATISATLWPGGFAADIQLVAGALVMVGLATRPAALVASGSMAYAYFRVHLPQGFWPITDHGELAVLFCWAMLLLAVCGPGPLSVDRLVARRFARRRSPTPTLAAQRQG